MATDTQPTLPASELSLDPQDRVLSILGVRVVDTTRPGAIRLLAEAVHAGDGRTRSIYFVNAHTLNLAAADATYRAILNAADYVFADGTGVRWAARLQGVCLQDNVNGTDLMPEFFRATGGGLRCFLLGSDDAILRRAAAFVEQSLGGWTVAGLHHGFLAAEKGGLAPFAGTARRVLSTNGACPLFPDPINAEAIRQIRLARPDVLLVGMGNPLQEQWIEAHREDIGVPLAIGVGGLFNFWSGNVPRAPAWLRRLGAEWLYVLCRQPHKARRYLLGNPLFLARILGDACLRKAAGGKISPLPLRERGRG